eukprot:4020189-Prymnesium_polylepis.1
MRCAPRSETAAIRGRARPSPRSRGWSGRRRRARRPSARRQSPSACAPSRAERARPSLRCRRNRRRGST